MSDSTHSEKTGRWSTLFLFTVIAVAAVGYFVGLADGVPKDDGIPPLSKDLGELVPSQASDKVVPAVRYSEIPETAMGPSEAFSTRLASLPVQPEYDLYKKIVPSEADKEASSKDRASRRAYNGAPPIIPHAVADTSDSACYSCHSGGLKIAGMKASVMSHDYLANCTQCHAPPPPAPFADVDGSVNNEFVGLAAPTAGKRAYPGAPPTIPHSRWMRQQCNACHGGPNGWAGMESTHPWRTNCTQCHAPSATLDQAISVPKVPMLPPIPMADN